MFVKRRRLRALLNGMDPFAQLTNLRRDRSGLAMIEFAYAMPFLLTVALTGTEVANLTITILRVNQLAMLASDNAARVRKSIDETDINEIMMGMKFAGAGIKFGENGRVIISALESNGLTGANAGYKITWQRCFGAKNVSSSYGNEQDGATDAKLADGMGPTNKKIVPVTNSALIFAEVRYTYHPIVASVFMGDRELTALQSFTVRERAQQALTNTTNLTSTQKRLCDTAHLSAN